MLQVDQLSEDEIAYIVLHIMAALERYKEEHKPTSWSSVPLVLQCPDVAAQIQTNSVSMSMWLKWLVTMTSTMRKLAGVDCIIRPFITESSPLIPVYKVMSFSRMRKWPISLKELVQADGQEVRQNRIKGKLTDFRWLFSKDYFAILEETDKDAGPASSALNDSGSDDQYEQEMLDLMNQRSKMSTVVFDEDWQVPCPIKALDWRTIKLRLPLSKTVWSGMIISNRFNWSFLISSSIYGNEGLVDINRGIVDLVDIALKEKMVACQDFEEFKELFLSLDQDR